MKEKKLSIKEVCYYFIAVVGLSVVAVCIGFAMKKSDVYNNNIVYDTSSEEYKEIESAYNKLRDYSDDYMIASVMELPEKSICYMEVVSDNGCSTEYPVDFEGNVGIIDFESEEDNIQYMLYDYMTPSNELYQIDGVQDNGEYSWVHMPKSYANDVLSREVMFFDRYLSNMTNIVNEGVQVLNAQTGDSFTTYTATIPSSVVRDVCSIDTLGLYKHIKEDCKDDENISNLMINYIDGLDKSMTFSDGKVTIGVSKDGILSYVRLEAGGLGNMMYYTKQLVTGDDITPRDIPDFSSANEYVDNIKDFADYVSSFDSYEDAMNSLYSGYNEEVITSVESSEDIVEESSEIIIEENSEEVKTDGN